MLMLVAPVSLLTVPLAALLRSVRAERCGTRVRL
jgi:hypothetical protein